MAERDKIFDVLEAMYRANSHGETPIPYFFTLNQARAMIEGNIFRNARQILEGNQTNPNAVYDAYNAAIMTLGTRVGLNFDIPQPPIGERELEKMKDQGEELIYLPQELASSEGRRAFWRLFPHSAAMFFDYFSEGSGVENTHPDQHGWLATKVRPVYEYNPRANAHEVITQIEKSGNQPATLNTDLMARALGEVLQLSTQDPQLIFNLGSMKTQHGGERLAWPQYISTLSSDSRIQGYSFDDISRVPYKNMYVREVRSL